MKIIPIFGNRLYSVHYDERETADEFERLFDAWQNPQFLEDFFNANESDLKNGFFGAISVNDAVITTRHEAQRLEQMFLRFASHPEKSLDPLFAPLNKTLSNDDFEKSKARGPGHKNWLRVYAIKISPGVYLITGGAIKLTAAMGEREHTKFELTKMDRCLKFLEENGISNVDGFLELFYE